MKLRYEILFNITLAAGYHNSAAAFTDLAIQPTSACLRLMKRFDIRHRKTPSGLMLYYRCSPFTNDTTPYKPIAGEETFSFLLKAVNPDFWFLADVNGWKQDSVFHLKNTVYNSAGDLPLHNGALSTALSFRPLLFQHEVTLEAAAGLLQLRNTSGVVLHQQVVRALLPGEAVGTVHGYPIDLRGATDGIYTIRHIKAGPAADTQYYCSADYGPGVLAVVDVTYKTGAWTGVKPFQNHTITVAARKTNWLFDVYVNKKSLSIYKPTKLSVRHKNFLPGPQQTFSVQGAADDVNGRVTFRSDALISYPDKPVELELVHNGTKVLVAQLPLPSAHDVQKDNLNNFFTQMIVNI
jgi:hypothetical protein